VIVMPNADPYRVLVDLARAGRALMPGALALRLDWGIDRVDAALRELVTMRPMPVGVDADGAYFITLPGRRRLRPSQRADRDVDDDGDEPDDGA
jgi:hypothetical protein